MSDMSELTIRAAEGCDADPFLLWDSLWRPNDGVADFRLAQADEPLNRGGLRSLGALATAVTLALFTDKRVPAEHPLAWLADGDRRGWWGDGADVRADLGESELGSLLWLLERAPLSIDGQSAARWAEAFALDALAPLQQQGVVVRIDVKAAAAEIDNRLDLTVNLYGRAGAAVYAQKFAVVWRQLQG
jgi:phage gp46-like protein